MQDFNLKIPPIGSKKDLTIIYKEGKDHFHEIKTSADDILKALRYFGKKSNEINQTKLIYIQEDIKFDLFESFIASISTNEIKINENNYQIYHYLSQKYEYNELKNQIEEFIKSRPDIFSILTELSDINENQTDSVKIQIDPEKEEIVAKNIDVAIKNGLLKKLPLSILIRILNSPKKVTNDHHLLFSFVIETIEKNISSEDEENLCFLTSSLDYCEMDSDEIEKLFSIQKKLDFFSPKNALKKMNEFVSFEKEIKAKYEEIEKRIQQISDDSDKKIQQLENSMNQSIENRLKVIEKRIDNIENNQQEFSSKQELNEKSIQEISSSYIEKNQQLENSLNKSFENKCKQIEKRIESIENNQQEFSSKQELNEKNIQDISNESNRKTQQLENSLNQSIDNRFQQIDKLISDVKELDNKLNKNVEQMQKANEDTQLKSSIKEIQNLLSVCSNELQITECKDGIFKYLFDIHKENPVNKGLIEIIGDSLDTNFQKVLPNIISSNFDYFWCSKPSENPFININFKNIFVQIHKYRIQQPSLVSYFKGWILKGITKDNHEIVIDEVNDINIRERNQLAITIEVKNAPFVHSVKIIKNGPNVCNDKAMRIYNVEFFGLIKAS